MSEDGSDNTHTTDENVSTGVKVHPQPLEVLSRKSDVLSNMEVSKLFEMVSSLKLAYIRCQEAHVPYDLEKIKAADEHFIAELEAVCKIESLYEEKKSLKLDSSISDVERKLEKLKSQVKDRESEIACLRQELQGLKVGNLFLLEKIKRENHRRKNLRVLDLNMFEDSFKAASKSIHDFAKPLIALMKAMNWDLDLAANSIENGVVYSKRCHKKYVYEAYISRRLFSRISLHSYNVDDIMRFDDPIDFLMENPNSDFARFCSEKYLLVIHPSMEASFFGNLDHRMLVSSGKHPRTTFYQVFAKMAKWVWILQGVATTIDSEAKLFAVNRGCDFSDNYMESVEDTCDEQISGKVEFMVMPGFKIKDAILKSRVYLRK